MEPLVSVIIPSFNRSALLRQCVGMIFEQDLAPNFEIIVVLDGSTDDSAEVLRALDSPVPLKIIEQANGGPGAARNRGVEEARAPYCVFVDDDVSLDSAALTAHLEAQWKLGGAATIGRLETCTARNGMPRQASAYFAARRQRLLEGPLSFRNCFSGNLGIPVRALRAVSGFDPSLRRLEDVELGLRLNRSGLALVYVDAARGEQVFTKTTRELLRDEVRAGESLVRLWRKDAALRRYFHIGGVTSGRGIGAALVGATSAMAIPDALFSAASAIPDWVPGSSRRAVFSQRYSRLRGVRRAVSDNAEWGALAATLRILRYAGFAGDQTERRAGHVPLAVFREQLAWLRSSSFRTVTLQGYLKALESATPPASDALVITIDGGGPNVGPALEMLQEFGIPGVVFVTWDLSHRPCEVPAKEWRRLAEAGFEIGLVGSEVKDAGSGFHESLVNALAREREALADLVGCPVAAYAHQARKVDPWVAAALDEAGYLVACRTSPGRGTWPADPYQLPRFPISERHSMRAFRWIAAMGDPPTVFPF